LGLFPRGKAAGSWS